MKINKRLVAIFTMLALIVSASPQLLEAVSGGITVDKTKASAAGEVATINMWINDPDGMIEAQVSTSGSVSVNATIVQSMSSQASVSVTINGSGSVTVDGFGIGADNSETPLRATYYFSVVPPTSGGGNNGGNTGGGNTGGGNTGSGNTGGSTSTGGGSSNTEDNLESIPDDEKSPEQLKEEKEKAEKIRKEELAKEQFVERISVISSDDKMHGETLKLINLEGDKLDYEFTLPKRIDKFLIDVEAPSKEVTLTFDKEHELKPEENEKKIDIRAIKDDVVKNYTLTVKRNTEKPLVVHLDGKEQTVYDDEMLTKFMKIIGFEPKQTKINDVMVPAYTNGSLYTFLTVDKDEAKWHLVDLEAKSLGKAVLLVNENDEPFFIQELKNGQEKEAINNSRYERHQLDVDKRLSDVDKELKFASTFNAWNLEDKSKVVYGINKDAKQGFYTIDADKAVNWAIIGFDTVNSNYRFATWGLSGALVVVSGALVASIIDRKGYFKSK